VVSFLTHFLPAATGLLVSSARRTAMVSLLSLSLCYFFDVGFAKAALQFCVQDFFTCSVTAIKECHSKKYAFCL